MTKARGPGTAGRPCGSMDQGLSGSVQLVDTAGPWTRTRVTRERCSTPWALRPVPESARKTSPHLGPCSPARAAPETWSNPRALGHWPDSPGPVCGPLKPLDTGPCGPGLLTDPVWPRTRARVPRDSLSTPQDLGPGPESHGTAGGPHKPSDLGPSRPGHLENPAGVWARA